MEGRVLFQRDYVCSFVTAVISIREKLKATKPEKPPAFYGLLFSQPLQKQAFDGSQKQKPDTLCVSGFVAFVGMARFELATPRPPDGYSKPC